MLAICFATDSVNPIQDLSVTPLSSSAIILRFTAPVPNTCAPTTTGYIVEYQLVNIGQCQDIADPVTFYHNTTQDLTVTLTGLEPYSTYEVFVTAQAQDKKSISVHASVDTIIDTGGFICAAYCTVRVSHFFGYPEMRNHNLNLFEEL